MVFPEMPLTFSSPGFKKNHLVPRKCTRNHFVTSQPIEEGDKCCFLLLPNVINWKWHKVRGELHNSCCEISPVKYKMMSVHPNGRQAANFSRDISVMAEAQATGSRRYNSTLRRSSRRLVWSIRGLTDCTAGSHTHDWNSGWLQHIFFLPCLWRYEWNGKKVIQIKRITAASAWQSVGDSFRWTSLILFFFQNKSAKHPFTPASNCGLSSFHLSF